MKGSKSAIRYAKALLDLSIEFKKVDQVSANMKELAVTCTSTKEFIVFLNSPVINSDKKIAILHEVFPHFEDVTSKFITLVTKNRREALLNEIAECFDMQVKEYKGIVPVTITSAIKLDEKTKDQLLGKLGASLKGNIELTEKIDTDIIGGFIVKMGDRQIDASVASQFSKLKQRLTK